MNSPFAPSSNVTPIPRASPLPWLIVAAIAIGWLLTFFMAQVRLRDEQQRSADALKGNDEVMARLHTAVSERKKAETSLEDTKARMAKLEERIEVLQAQLKAKEDEAAAAAARPKPRPSRR